MASPFPGMDPYLESPDWFPNLHDGLITFLVGALNRGCPSPIMPGPDSASGSSTRTG